VLAVPPPAYALAGVAVQHLLGSGKSTFDSFVDRAESDRFFELWRDALPD
jgi:hypothetical protein